MTGQDKFLYHQIHAAKLATDWATGLMALFFFWRHDLLIALLVAIVPSILASYLVIRLADLEELSRSRFGRYIQKYMTEAMQVLRLAGYVAMALGAWRRNALIIVLGFLVVLAAWMRGIVLKQLHEANKR